MALTDDDLSLWELAHRLSDSDPNRRYWTGLPLEVRDNVRLLIHEIYSAHLDSTLIMEKWRPDSDLPPEFFIRHHLDEIWDCLAGKSTPRKLAEFIRIDRWEFHRWCNQSGHELPDFWFSIDYQWPLDDEEEPQEPPKDGSARSQLAHLRAECRRLATEAWKENPDLPQAQVARRIRDSGVAKNYEENTVKKWIRSVAPDGVKRKPGRPKKT